MTFKDGDNVPVVQAVPIPAEDGNDHNNYGSSSANNGSHPIPSAPLYEGPYEDPSPPPSYQQQEQHGAVVTTIPGTTATTATTTHVPPQRRNDNDCCCIVCGSIAATVALICFCLCVLPVIIFLAIFFSVRREVMDNMDDDNHFETQFDDY